MVIVMGSTVVKVWPEDYFWVEHNNARMPVWVRGNTASGTFIVFNHGGPGSWGTAESIISRARVVAVGHDNAILKTNNVFFQI